MLSADIDRYLALRRALGWKLVRTERHLRAFARHTDDRGDTHIRSATLMEWVTAAGCTRNARAERLRVLIRFARFLHAEDPRHEVPAANIFGVSRPRPSPYIYAPEEIARILDAAGALRRQRPNPLRRELYVTELCRILGDGGHQAAR